MKNSILIILFITVPTFTYSQAKVDTNLVEFKAKLLTLSLNGLECDSTAVIQDVINQQAKILNLRIDDLLFFKIKFSQRFHNCKKESSIEWIGSCNYYIVYNNEKCKFYRLGGWDTNDVNDFVRNLSVKQHEQILSEKVLNNGDIDFLCLLLYSSMSEKKRKRKGYNCLKKCSNELSTTFRVN